MYDREPIGVSGDRHVDGWSARGGSHPGGDDDRRLLLGDRVGGDADQRRVQVCIGCEGDGSHAATGMVGDRGVGTLCGGLGLGVGVQLPNFA